MCYAVLRPGWWVPPVAVLAAVTLVIGARAAEPGPGHPRGCQRGAMTMRGQLVLGGPAALLIIAGAAAPKVVPWVLAVAAVLVFLVFAGTGLTMSARAARP